MDVGQISEMCYGFGGMDYVKIMNFYKKLGCQIFFQTQAGRPRNMPAIS